MKHAASPPQDPMMKWFSYQHLPLKLQEVSANFHLLATKICHDVVEGPERTASLRKLLEAKDAAVRATVSPGN